MQDSSETVGFDSVVVRFSGEIWIKGAWTRRFYVGRLLRNMRRVLKFYGLDVEAVSRVDGRLFLKTDKAEEVVHRLAGFLGFPLFRQR